MRRGHKTETVPTNDSAIVTKALLRAAEALGLTDAELGSVVGVHASTVSRMRTRGATVDLGRKEGEAALAFIRFYRSLSALLVDKTSCGAWFRANNRGVRGVPAERVRTFEGLIDVGRYVDAMRGKV